MHSVTTSVRASPSAAVIRVRGEIDLLAEPDLRHATGIVVDERCREVTLDLNDVSFLDCAGLDALLSCRERVAASGGSVRLGRTSRAVSRLLTMTSSREGWATAAVLAPEASSTCRPSRAVRSTGAGFLAGSPRTRRWTGHPRHPNLWAALREPAAAATRRRAS